MFEENIAISQRLLTEAFGAGQPDLGGNTVLIEYLTVHGQFVACLGTRDRIEARAAQKFGDVELEGNPPGIILRAIDFRPPR